MKPENQIWMICFSGFCFLVAGTNLEFHARERFGKLSIAGNSR